MVSRSDEYQLHAGRHGHVARRVITDARIRPSRFLYHPPLPLGGIFLRIRDHLYANTRPGHLLAHTDRTLPPKFEPRLRYTTVTV